jgi:hypothetical protein
VLDLPFGHGKKYLTDATGFVDKLVGGWGVDGMTIFQKGFPLAFGNAIPNYITSYGGGSRPNVVAGCNKSSGLGGSAKLGEWFNAACFTAPADFTYGNESRTDPTLRSSAVNNWDFALFKKTMFGPDERLGIAFRAEFFNSTSSVATNGRLPILPLAVQPSARSQVFAPARTRAPSSSD